MKQIVIVGAQESSVLSRVLGSPHLLMWVDWTGVRVKQSGVAVFKIRVVRDGTTGEILLPIVLKI